MVAPFFFLSISLNTYSHASNAHCCCITLESMERTILGGRQLYWLTDIALFRFEIVFAGWRSNSIWVAGEAKVTRRLIKNKCNMKWIWHCVLAWFTQYRGAPLFVVITICVSKGLESRWLLWPLAVGAEIKSRSSRKHTGGGATQWVVFKSQGHLVAKICQT